MALSNQGEKVRVINPINNCRYFKSVFSAKQDKEGFYVSVYYTEPERDVFPDDESYEIAYAIFQENEKSYAKSEESGLSVRDNEKGGKSYQLDLTLNTQNGGTYQAISGRLLNFYPLADIFPDGKKKQKFIADLWDEKSNERYGVEISIAVFGRKFIDKVIALTPEQLQHPIQFSFNRFEINGQPKMAAKLYVLDPAAEYGRVEIEGKFEIATWDEKNGYTATPKGTAAENKVFLKALNAKLEDGNDKPFVKFYTTIVENFQSKVLNPIVVKMFAQMGWDMEIKDRMGRRKVKNETVEMKVKEIIHLISNGTEETEKNVEKVSTEENKEESSVDSGTGDEASDDDLPF